MSQIVLYTGEMFTGSYDTYATDVQNYQDVTSLPQVRSLKVSSGTWIVYSEKDFSGDIAVYKAGNYGSGLKIKTIGSFRKLSGHLENPVITVFDQTSYQGSHQEFKDPEYQTVRLPILSHKVGNGVWILYNSAGLHGKSIVSIQGDEVTDESVTALEGPVKSLKAYLIYEDEKQ
ncbi:gamma-crystallin N-like [Bufo gargarizans]|uniref:gamma-crystallin N-like n=1 Tax=Bufo gargarizans TaxID=30331 RepID=UPI001CF1488A|nr:gamma-crystallin N-like [Bufo gargarizans]